MSSYTPRTDAAELDLIRNMPGLGERRVMTAFDFARTLERELAESNAILSQLQNLHSCSREMVQFWCWRAANAAKEVSAEQQRLLQDAQEEVARWQSIAQQASAEREHNANVVGQLRAEVAKTIMVGGPYATVFDERNALRKIVEGGYAERADDAHPAIAVARAALVKGAK